MNCKLRITVAQRNAKSYLENVFSTPPLRAVPVGQLKKDGAEYVMLTSTSPGILSDDHYDIEITVKEKARIQLLSQSYQRLYNMDVPATQKMNVSLQQGSSFSYVPHPVVPHKNSKFTSTNHLQLQENCEVLFSEIITCGRKHHGEVFRYAHFQGKTEIYFNDKLIFKDNILLQPDTMPLTSIGYMEGYTHQGSLIYLNTKNQEVKEKMEEVYLQLEGDQDITFGISTVSEHGFAIRILGNEGDKLYKIFKKVQKSTWS